MDYNIFLLNLGLAFCSVLLPLYYLRPAIRTVLITVCHGNDSGAAFWLRATDVLAFSGTLILVLMFGKTQSVDAVESIRLTLMFTLIGVFITVTIVTTSVWRLVVTPLIYGDDLTKTLDTPTSKSTNTSSKLRTKTDNPTAPIDF